MKIILDESTPQSWSGLKNGALLVAAEEAGFDLFITADQELSYQQNLTGRRIAKLRQPLMQRLLAASSLSKLATAGDNGPPISDDE